MSAAWINPDWRWTLTIPTMSLPEGNKIFRVWSYDRTQDKLVQIGSDIPMKMDH